VHPIGWRTSLRVFILYANPVGLSFGAALLKQSVDALRSRGHEIDDCDLYAERFNPVMSEQERTQYHNLELNRAPIGSYADRLLAAEALVLIYPVWNEGFPAILKGFFDRVFIPGVSFNVGPDGAIVPNLKKLRKLAAVCTYGATRTISFLLGDPPKRVVKRLVLRCLAIRFGAIISPITTWIIPLPNSGSPSCRRSGELLTWSQTDRTARCAEIAAPRGSRERDASCKACRRVGTRSDRGMRVIATCPSAFGANVD
jgi:NAD(P)H dehydrogenase (quinone)